MIRANTTTYIYSLFFFLVFLWPRGCRRDLGRCLRSRGSSTLYHVSCSHWHLYLRGCTPRISWTMVPVVGLLGTTRPPTPCRGCCLSSRRSPTSSRNFNAKPMRSLNKTRGVRDFFEQNEMGVRDFNVEGGWRDPSPPRHHAVLPQH